MPVRNANATWTGNLQNGEGSMAVESGAFEGQYSFGSRFEDGTGTNPEELIGAAHAGCFSMALANELAEAGYEPETIDTDAAVYLDADSLSIEEIELTVEGTVSGIDSGSFREFADGAKENCPVSKALTGVEITFESVRLD